MFCAPRFLWTWASRSLPRRLHALRTKFKNGTELLSTKVLRRLGQGLGCKVRARCVHLVDDGIFQHHFLLRTLQDVFFDGALREKAEHANVKLGVQAVGARHGL